MEFGSGLTVISGPNGAGKTNALEALYFACTGRSCRTKNEREVVRFGEKVMRLELGLAGRSSEITVGFSPGEAKRFTVDGCGVPQLSDHPGRPLVSVFMPDRLELLLGPPALRRAHLDQVVAALWPARAEARRSYSSALAQRNALVSRIRAGVTSRDSLSAWNAELARHGVALMQNRTELVELLSPRFTDHAERLGLEGGAEVGYRPRSQAATADELAAEFEQNTQSDIDAGYTTHGPHRDELRVRREGKELRAYGSRGQVRMALLSLLLAERDEIAQTRSHTPLMLLDEAMSELDGSRRERLIDVLTTQGQSVVTTTELEHVPRVQDSSVARVEARAGSLMAL